MGDLKSGKTKIKLIGHTRDVLSVALSADYRQVLTGGRDHHIKIWNVRGECKHTVDKNAHTDAFSCVRFYHQAKPAVCVTASWDKTIKVWDNTYMKLMHTFMGHKAQINSIDMVNNSTYLASGSHDGQVMIWDVIQGKWLTSYEYDSPRNSTGSSSELRKASRSSTSPPPETSRRSRRPPCSPTSAPPSSPPEPTTRSEPPSTSLALPSPGTSLTTNSTPVSPITSSESTRLTRSPTERIAESRRLTPLLVAFSIITFDTHSSSIKHSIISP